MGIERCKHCGRTWGVTTPPRIDIRCSDCLRRPDLYPARYWRSRRASLSYLTGPLLKHRSPQWHDWQTSMDDLTHAVECAEKLEAEIGVAS